MYQASRRYLSTADVEARRLVGSALSRGRRGLGTLPRFRYEVPDTTFLALVGTSLNLLNATTGPGLLALPLAFSRCGWGLGTILLLLVFALNHASLGLLLRACLATREHSYIGLCTHVSRFTASLIDWSSLAFFFGSSVSYLVIIGEAFTVMTAPLGSGVLYEGGPVSDGPLHYSAIALLLLILFTLVVLAPLSFLRSMDSLQCTSALGIFCLMYAVFVIVAYRPYHGASLDGANSAAIASITTTVPPPSPPTLPMFVFSAEALVSLPTLTFCFSSQSLFPPALETLHQPATYNFMNSVVDITMYLTLAIHLAVGLAGSLAFGHAVAPNVLDSLPQTPGVLAARLCVVLAFAFTFPMMVFLCRMHLRSIIARARASGVSAGVAQLAPATGIVSELLASERDCSSDLSMHSGVESVHGRAEAGKDGNPATLSTAPSEDDLSIHGFIQVESKGAVQSAASVRGGEGDEGDGNDPAGAISQSDGFRHNLVSGLLVGASLVCAIFFPNIDAIFGLLGGTTSVVLSFVAPAIFWEVTVGYMFSWHHPIRLFCKTLVGFSALIASLSLPGVLIDLLGDLYATTWYVPMASSAGLSTWKGSAAPAIAAARMSTRASPIDIALAASKELPKVAKGAANAVASAAVTAATEAASRVRGARGGLLVRKDGRGKSATPAQQSASGHAAEPTTEHPSTRVGAQQPTATHATEPTADHPPTPVGAQQSTVATESTKAAAHNRSPPMAATKAGPSPPQGGYVGAQPDAKTIEGESRQNYLAARTSPSRGSGGEQSKKRGKVEGGTSKLSSGMPAGDGNTKPGNARLL